MMRNFILLLFALISFSSYSQTNSVFGEWGTYDDNTGELKSSVEIYQKGDRVYGKVTKLFLPPDEPQDPVCEECDEDDPRYLKKIIGMEILQDLELDGDEYSGGTVLDPENGNVYKCKIWLEGGNLIIRGYIGFSWIGRSQTWKRLN